jgi:hypothetical protein
VVSSAVFFAFNVMIYLVRDSRAGECLWQEWSGEGIETTRIGSILFYTDEHVDIENDIVRRALASALQRDGSAVTLGHGYRAVENGITTQGYAGSVDGSHEMYVCNEDGETPDGDYVDDVIEVTWVEV